MTLYKDDRIGLYLMHIYSGQEASSDGLNHTAVDLFDKIGKIFMAMTNFFPSSKQQFNFIYTVSVIIRIFSCQSPDLEQVHSAKGGLGPVGHPDCCHWCSLLSYLRVQQNMLLCTCP